MAQLIKSYNYVLSMLAYFSPLMQIKKVQGRIDAMAKRIQKKKQAGAMPEAASATIRDTEQA